jgi:glycosyltransferase involved in cell wall biosynthesis
VNILFLTPQLPYPPRQGTAIRNWGLIRRLAARHVLTLVSFGEPGQAPDAPELAAACPRVITLPTPRRTPGDRLRTLLSPHPDLARRLWSPGFARALAGLLRDSAFDVIQIEGLEMAPYLPALQEALLHAPRFIAEHPVGTPHTVYDAHNAEHVLQRRAFAADVRQPARWPAALYSWLQIPRLRKFEASVCRAADAVTCVSEEDAAALRQLVPALRPVVVPNGIEVADYAEHAPRAAQTPARLTLVFTGKMDYRPNLDAVLWFAGEILPRIRAARPEAQLVVVGQKPPERLLKLNGRNGVVITGAVEDVRPFIAGAAVYVAPLRMGGGTRFKLLQAMALARPIVSTTVGAEGFAVRSGRELLLADSPAGFAAEVLALLDDPARAAALGRAGQAFVRAGYDWSAITPKLEAVYAGGRAGTTGRSV